MLSVEEAQQLVLREVEIPPPHQVPISTALGLALDENVTSDVDSPPHDKSIVDGYAVVAASVTSPQTELRVIEEVTAGQVPTRVVESGTATRIMTGAPLPVGADAVVMVEKTTTAEGPSPRVRILEAPVKPGQNIVRRGTSMRRGDEVLAADFHRRLRPAEIGLLAEVGRTTVQVLHPTAAILATGNELVPASQVPGPGQIRNSNGPMLAALAKDAGVPAPVDLGIACDELANLRDQIEHALGADVVILSGGVSAGVLDLVPQALAACGVRQVFHKVNVKPGKPIWFGTCRREGQNRLVFGLPGNPVSSLVCFELFVRPALKKLAGHKEVLPATVAAVLTKDHQQRGERVTYWPSRLVERPDGRREVTPLPWQGSGDLRTLANANTLAIFPPGDRQFAAGEEIRVMSL